MPSKVLFLTLRIFSVTGGIEKVCRVIGKALYETGMQQGWQPVIHSMDAAEDASNNNSYFPQLLHKSFGKSKIAFVLRSIRTGRKAQTVILSHINLLIAGYAIKLINPKVELVLLAHGIEVWEPLNRLKKKMLRKCDLILPVSNFTKEKMKELHGLADEKFAVLNNSLDPYLERPLIEEKDKSLLERYGLQADDTILLTVGRMSDAESYKGYDRVIQSLPLLAKQYPQLKYLLAGSYGEQEKKRLDTMISQYGLQDVVKFAGYVAETELAAHFNLADIFIMPSEKEGFGIVFIEAMFYGRPVVAGNADGSVDALVNGEMGLLVDPLDVKAIAAAIKKMVDNTAAYLPDAKKLEAYFGYPAYKKKLQLHLN